MLTIEKRRWSTLALATSLALFAAACGNDDATTSTTESPSGAPSALPECLDFLDLYALVGPESTGFGTWADGDELAAEIGAPHAPYPDVDLAVAGPGEESGTFDTFVEFVVEGVATERGLDATTRPDYRSSPNDNLIIQNLQADDSLGWVGYAFYVENVDSVRAFQVSAGRDCVEPTPETIASGEYPFSRPLYVYVNNESAEENGSVSAWVDAYVNDLYSCVTDAGYVALAPDALADLRSAADPLIGGTDDGGDVIVSGSSTVEPISACVSQNGGFQGSVEGPGTGDGFRRFCNGETDVSDASRPIKAEESEICDANGITYTELLVGIDGIAVITSV